MVVVCCPEKLESRDVIPLLSKFQSYNISCWRFLASFDGFLVVMIISFILFRVVVKNADDKVTNIITTIRCL